MSEQEGLIATKEQRWAKASKEYDDEQVAKEKLGKAAHGPMGRILAKLLSIVSSPEDFEKIASNNATPLAVRFLQKAANWTDYSLFPLQTMTKKLPDGTRITEFIPTAEKKE